MAETIRLTKQNQRLLKLVYKFRFVTAPLLAKLLNIRHDSTYEALQSLLKLGLLARVYEESWRIDRRPAYYYLSSKGVTTVRNLLDIEYRAVNTIYQDHRASPDFLQQCLTTLSCYIAIKQQLPPDTTIRTKTEINRFTVFPKYRPDLYIKTSGGQEAFVIIAPDKLPYFVNKRVQEYIDHSEEDGWHGRYPTIGVILKDHRSKLGFLYKTKQKLEDMGIDAGNDELIIKASSIDRLTKGSDNIWGSAFSPTKYTDLLSD